MKDETFTLEQRDTPDAVWAVICAASDCVGYACDCDRAACEILRDGLREAVKEWEEWRKTSQSESPPLESATILRLEPGDVLAVSHPLVLSDKAIENLLGSVKAQFPDHTCILLEEGAKLQVVRPSKAAEAS